MAQNICICFSNADGGAYYSNTTTDSYSAQLNLNQNIFSGFADVNKYNQALANSQYAQANLQSVRAKVSADLKQSIAALNYAHDYKKLTTEIIKRRSDNLKNVELRFESGRENKGSTLLSQAYLEQARLDDLNADNLLRTANLDLNRLLAVEQDDEEIVFDFNFNGNIDHANSNDFAQLCLTTPDVRAAQAQELASSYDVNLSKSNFYPSLDFTASAGKMDSSFFPHQDKWSLGLTLTIPLFDGGKDYSSVQSSSYKQSSLALQTKETIKDIKIKLQQAYANLAESIQQEKVDMSFKAAAEVRAQIARSKYNNGLMSFEEWDQVETDFINRQKALLVSRKNKLSNQALWEKTLGTGLFK